MRIPIIKLINLRHLWLMSLCIVFFILLCLNVQVTIDPLRFRPMALTAWYLVIECSATKRVQTIGRQMLKYII